MQTTIQYVQLIETEDLVKTLEKQTSLILDCFRINEMKSNDDKCHLIVCNRDNVTVTLGNETIEGSLLDNKVVKLIQA